MVKDSLARITQTQSWGNYHLFALESPSVSSAARPGQFLMVRVAAQPYPLLRRPFSIHARNGNSLEIFFQIAGLGTALLAEKKAGELLDILGPLGKGFAFGENLKGKVLWAMGGGRGIAPLYFLCRELCARGASVKILYSAKSLRDLPLLEKFKKNGFDPSASTDDGSFGFHGLASDLLRAELVKVKPDQLFVCGPETMMEAVAGISLKEKIPSQFSIESLMGCGFGACWGCVKRIKRAGTEDWVKICEEGPVFEASEIVWGENVP